MEQKISARLLDERLRLDLNKSQMAARGGVAHSTYLRYESGERSPDGDFLAALAEAGVDALYVLTGQRSAATTGDRLSQQQSPDNSRVPPNYSAAVPRYDVRASAGGGAVLHDELIVDYVPFKREWLQRTLGLDLARTAVIGVHGDSMSPTLEHNDWLLLDTRPERIKSDGIYVINLNDALLVKRVRIKLSGAVEIVSDNPRYGSETVSGEELSRLNVVGRVVWCGHAFDWVDVENNEEPSAELARPAHAARRPRK